MFQFKGLFVGLLAVTVVLLTSGVDALAAPPTIGVDPSTGMAGSDIRITGNGYTPGGYAGTILWDGLVVETFFIPSGFFIQPFTIPTSASPGTHTLKVCAGTLATGGAAPSGCFTGRFEQEASISFTVTAGPPSPTGTFNVQIQAVEVTQGIRGDIPTRASPNGEPILRRDFTVHVANRRTIVRVYPWVFVEPGSGRVPRLTATMWGDRHVGNRLERLPGPPLSPINPLLEINPSWTLNQMRSNENRSWNFVLPNSWVRAGEIRLYIQVNPLGRYHQDECRGCAGDNIVNLLAVHFETVQTREIDVRIYAADVYWRASSAPCPGPGDSTTPVDGPVSHVMPTNAQIARAINWWIKTWPLSPENIRLSWRTSRISQDFRCNNRRVLTPIPGAPQWDNQVYKDENPDIDSSGLRSNPYPYIPLLFSPTSPIGCSGRAGVGGPPLFHAGACGPTFAQEAAHTLGFKHASGVHGEDDGIDRSYPGPHGEIEPNAYGFDIFGIRAIPPTSGPAHTHDFMSYGWLGNLSNAWVSLYTWRNLVGAFGASSARAVGSTSPVSASNIFSQASSTDHLRISGIIAANGAVSFDPVFLVSSAQVADSVGQGNYRLELRDSDGTLLLVRQVEPNHRSCSTGCLGPTGTSEFYEFVPITPGLAQVALLKGSTTLAVLPVSRNVPKVSLTSPVKGDRWAASGTAIVAWKASDADGDPLLFRVEASPDGVKWVILASGIRGDRAAIDLSTVPGGGQGWRVRVQASDGVNVTVDEVKPISVAHKPPRPLIVTPLDGDIFTVGQEISLFGLVADAQDQKIPDSAIEWLVEGHSLGEGQQSSISNLGPGKHSLTLRATNKAGLVGEMAISITVEKGESIPNPSPSPSISGGSLQLDGNGDYLKIPFAKDLNALDSLTLEAWVRRSSNSRCEAVLGNGWRQSYWLGFCSGPTRFYHGAGQYTDAVTVIPSGQWTHVAVTYDGITSRTYVNGKLDHETTEKAGPLEGTDGLPLFIGGDRDGGYYFQGLIDEVRVWNVVRSQTQIQNAFQREVDGPQPGLLAVWHFNGDTKDAAGDHHGSLVGQATFSTEGFPTQGPLSLAKPRNDRPLRGVEVVLHWEKDRFTLELSGQNIERVRLQLFNLAGQQVLEQEALGKRLHFLALDKVGRPLANGVYLYVVTVTGYDGQLVRSRVKKLVILR